MITKRRVLRERFRTLRKSLDADERAACEAAIADELRGYPPLARAERVAVYLATNGEVDLSPWITTAWQTDKLLAVPCLGEPGAMVFRGYAPDARMTANRYGIREPIDSPVVEDFDHALVPLVAYDERGTRLGMGGGYYDRYFADTSASLIGIAFACQRSAERLPRAHWDVPLDAIVTEDGIMEF